jgi:hypothetical protein
MEWIALLERNHLEDPGVDGRIILRWIFRKWDGVEHEMDCYSREEPLGRPRPRWEDNIKMDLQEMG